MPHLTDFSKEVGVEQDNRISIPVYEQVIFLILIGLIASFVDFLDKSQAITLIAIFSGILLVQQLYYNWNNEVSRRNKALYRAQVNSVSAMLVYIIVYAIYPQWHLLAICISIGTKVALHLLNKDESEFISLEGIVSTGSFGKTIDFLLLQCIPLVLVNTAWLGDRILALEGRGVGFWELIIWIGLLVILATYGHRVIYGFVKLPTTQRYGMLMTQMLVVTSTIMMWLINNFEHEYFIASFLIAFLLLAMGISMFTCKYANDSILSFLKRETNTALIAIFITIIAAAVGYLVGWGPLGLRTGSSISMVISMICFSLVFIRFVIIRIDDAERISRLHDLVWSDSLTGVGSRHALLLDLTRKRGWLLIGNINNFERVNNLLGYQEGDELLKRFAIKLQSSLSRDAFLYRLSGDEFAVIVSGNREAAEKAADHMRESISNLAVSNMTLSIGIAQIDRNNTDETLRNVDFALRKAKQSIIRKHVFIEDEGIAKYHRSLIIREELTRGGVEDIFFVFQPIVSVENGNTVVAGIEALARYESPQLGLVSPLEFISILEQEGTIGVLGNNVVKKAISVLEEMIRRGRVTSITVNISVLHLHDTYYLRELMRILTNARHVVSWLIIEVTETVSGDEALISILDQLRRTGVKIAVDDFGAGSSNVWRVSAVPAQVLKIDRSLALDLEQEKSLSLLRAIVNLGQRSGMDVIVEGIETEDMAKKVIEAGASLIQGYLYARPGDLSALDGMELSDDRILGETGGGDV